MSHFPSRLVTGHNLVSPEPTMAPLEFSTDPELVHRCRDAVSSIGQRRQQESRVPLVRDTTFERGHAYIGSAMSDGAWIDEQWGELTPAIYREAADAIASDDLAEAGRVLKAAFEKLAHREAERRFGTAL